MFGRSAVGALTLDPRDAVSIELMRGETQYAHLANRRFELFGQFDAIADDSFYLGVDSVHRDLYGPCEPTFRHKVPAENGYAPSSLACNEDNADKAKCVAVSRGCIMSAFAERTRVRALQQHNSERRLTDCPPVLVKRAQRLPSQDAEVVSVLDKRVHLLLVYRLCELWVLDREQLLELALFAICSISSRDELAAWQTFSSSACRRYRFCSFT